MANRNRNKNSNQSNMNKSGGFGSNGSKNANLLLRSANHSTANALGARYAFTTRDLGTAMGYKSLYFPPESNTAISTGYNRGYLDVPGIMTFEVALVPGLSSDGQSPINVASEQMHNWLKSVITSSLGFDAPDTMMFCMTMDNIYCYYVWMQRLYGIANNYQVLNRYAVDALISANHVDPVDLRNNKDKLAYYMEQFAVYARAFSIPTSMPYFKEHADLFAHVYKDGEDDKAQMYMFVPYGFYSFNSTPTSSPKGKLDFNFIGELMTGEDLTYKQLSVAEIIQLGETLLTGVRNSDDASNIQSALLKAFGYNTYELSSTPFEYKVTPEYNEEILMQIHNIQCIGRISSNSDIYQNEANEIIFRPSLTDSGLTEVVIDCAWNNPTPDQILKMTRYSGLYDAGGTGSLSTGVFGSEIVCDIFISKYFHSQTAVRLGFARLSTVQSFSVQGSEQAAFLDLLCDYEKFDWAPLLYYFPTSLGAETTYAPVRIFGDFENFSVYTWNELANIHNVRLLNLFDVPRTKLG